MIKFMKAVFLDRDGTVNIEYGEGKIDSPERAVLLPHTMEALKELAQLDYGVFFVTNQLGIALGKYDEERFWEVNSFILQTIAPSGVDITKTYMCPHNLEDNCECHKPKPGMILQAAKEYDIDLSQSYTIGDRMTDIGAGLTAGTKTILVQTGDPPVLASDEATYVATDLLDAIRWIASH